MKDIIIPTGSLITRKIEDDQLTIHSPRRPNSLMINFKYFFAGLLAIFLLVAVFLALQGKPITVIFTIPFWLLAYLIFRNARNASTLEQWLILKDQEIIIRKKSASKTREWTLIFDKIKAIEMKSAPFWDTIKYSSYYSRQRDRENEDTLYPTIILKGMVKKRLTFFENASEKERNWITASLQEIVPSPEKQEN